MEGDWVNTLSPAIYRLQPAMPPSLPFTLLSPGVGIGAPAPGGWEPAGERPLLVLVGVTGVGKSTALKALKAHGFAFHLLPDRRELTDRVIIAEMQTQAGETMAPVNDRKQRFAYTRAYRNHYPGGMAQAMTQLAIDPAALPGVLIFDGLRGDHEVTHAAALLPAAHFVVLEAPDGVRLARLIGRSDPFDQIGGETRANPRLDGTHTLTDAGAPEAASLCSRCEDPALLELVRSGAVTADALRSALAIVTEERRNYDPAAASAALRRVAPARSLFVDTASLPAKAVAAQIAHFAEVLL